MSTRTRFEEEAKGNSEMVYSNDYQTEQAWVITIKGKYKSLSITSTQLSIIAWWVILLNESLLMRALILAQQRQKYLTFLPYDNIFLHKCILTKRQIHAFFKSSITWWPSQCLSFYCTLKSITQNTSLLNIA